MNRGYMLDRLRDTLEWDVLIIGGGATGLGAAVDSASRGYQTLLLEQGDFAQGTSSRSTKLIHGGLRYLRQGHLGFVRQSLRERTLLLQNAPHLVHPLTFVLPASHWARLSVYYAGIKLYDLLAGSQSLAPSQLLSAEDLHRRVPALTSHDYAGAISFSDGQFDDARLAIALAQTACDQGATVLNYLRVEKLRQVDGQVRGVRARDLENDQPFELRAKVVINATGAFVDTIRRMDDRQAIASISPSQGTHIVVDRSFFSSDCGLIIPRTSDGRLIFILPWLDRVLIGTTESSVNLVSLEPRPTIAEVQYLLANANAYLEKRASAEDILSAFAGIRPLIKAKGSAKQSSALARDYALSVSDSGLVSMTGGKWTTYRLMGEETMDLAARQARLPHRRSGTSQLPVHGWTRETAAPQPWRYYGSDSDQVDRLAEQDPTMLELLHPKLPCRGVDIVWAVRKEMARTIEDVLSRRTRCLLLDARASVEVSEKVASLMARELGRDSAWEQRQVSAYADLSRRYQSPI